MLISLRPGADRRQVADSIGELLLAISNVRTGGHTAADRYSKYLEWANRASSVLTPLISEADLDRLILTRRFWTLQSTVYTTGPLHHLLDVEIAQRVYELTDARDALKRQIKLWSRAGVFAVADTSVFIEAEQKLRDLDMAPLVRVREEPIHLLVPILIVDELDGLKRHSDRHVRWRAGHTLGVLAEVLGSGLGPGRLRDTDFSALDTGGIPRGEITVEVVLDPPRHQRLSINDDEIVERAVAIQGLAGRPIRFLTCDTRMVFRARAANLDVVTPRRISSEDRRKASTEPS